MRRALSLAFVSVLALTGCNDDPQTAPTSATTTTNSGGNGGWGGAGGDGGDGGNGAGAGMGGMGGVGGQGGMGGMGGAPSWSEQCIAACQKLDQQCNQQNLCGNLGINCGGTPPAEPLECMFGCLSEPSTTCDDFNDWLDVNKSPASPNQFIQCLSACPTAAPVSPNPTLGCAECIGAMCGSEFAACQGEAACNDNWVQCAMNCTDPACYRQCDIAHPNNSIAPLYSCMCNWTAGQHTNPVSTYVGTGDCTDVCGGLIDPCNG